MSWGDADDATLVRDAQAGDASSLGALLERHRALLLAAAVGRLGHGPQAEDAVQDTFLIALRRIGQLRNPAAARGWLLAILVNVCRMQVRRTPVEPVMDLGEGWAAEPGSVEEVIDRLALRDWVWAALERLSEPLRLAVMLRYFTAAASYEAIADLCAIPVGTVRSRLHAGRARLADELLAIASAPHPDAARWRQQAGEVGCAMAAFERSGDDGLLREVFAADLRFTLADRVERRGLDRFTASLAADFEDGISSRPIRVVAGAELTVAELWLDSPSDQPLHCPPAVTQVYFHRDRATRRVSSHYAH